MLNEVRMVTFGILNIQLPVFLSSSSSDMDKLAAGQVVSLAIRQSSLLSHYRQSAVTLLFQPKSCKSDCHV